METIIGTKVQELICVRQIKQEKCPEDLILYKLIYFGLSQQSKHSRDIAAILKAKKSELDLEYIERWAIRLGLTSLWKEMLDNVS